MKSVFGLAVLGASLLFPVCPAASPAGEQPVYVYLHARVSDHVNVELTESRLRRILPMLDKYRKQQSKAGVSATILVSGALSQALADRNGKTGIKDFVQDYARRGVIELGYDGADEPTYRQRPAADLTKTKTSVERWMARGAAAERLLTEMRDPLTGVVVPGKPGGLRQMQAIFGEAACITGLTAELGGDPEFVHHAGQYNHKAIMFGFPDPDPNPAKALVAGFRESAQEFAREMSPIPESSPELFWQDHVLRSSETSDAAIRRVSGYEGPAVLKELVAKLNRSKIRVIHVELGDQRLYLKPDYAQGNLYPPVRFAYEHPDSPKLPREALQSEDEVAGAYQKEEALIRWLLEDYFPSNPGSRFVSSTDLQRMTPPSAGFSVSLEKLRPALAEILSAAWDANTTYPPMYVLADGHYLSLADLFQVLTDAMTELHRTGKFPQSVKVSKVYGPVPLPDDRGTFNGEVTVASVAKVCATLAGDLHDTSWSPLPKNRIPSRVTIDGLDLNSGQFLRLMSEGLLASSKDAKLRVKMTQMLSVSGWSVPTTRPQEDQSASWTYKPAPLKLP